MRQIKFRGKTKYGSWVYGYYFLKITEEGEPIHQIIENYADTNRHNPGMKVNFHQVRPETVGQFTGRKDKFKGKEIYEGQKVRGFYDKTLVGENEFHEDGVVVWNNELGSFSIDRGDIKPAFSCFDSFKILED